MFRELIKYGAESIGKAKVFEIAVEAGNYEIFKFCWEEAKFNPTQDMIDRSVILAVQYGHLQMLEVLFEKGTSCNESFLPARIAIRNKQNATLLFVLKHGYFTLSGLKYVYGELTDKDACITLPTILKFYGLMGIHNIKLLLGILIEYNYYRCMDIFTQYLSDNALCEFAKILQSASREETHLSLLELAGDCSYYNARLFRRNPSRCQTDLYISRFHNSSTLPC